MLCQSVATGRSSTSPRWRLPWRSAARDYGCREAVLSEIADLGGGPLRLCSQGVKIAGPGQPGGCGSVDFGPGIASWKGMAGPPSFHGSPQLQLFILSMQGVAGCDPGRAAQEGTSGSIEGWAHASQFFPFVPAS